MSWEKNEPPSMFKCSASAIYVGSYILGTVSLSEPEVHTKWVKTCRDIGEPAGSSHQWNHFYFSSICVKGGKSHCFTVFQPSIKIVL